MLLLLFIYLIYVSKTHFQTVTEPEKFYIEGTIIICFWIAVLFDTRESIQPVKVEWQGAGMVVCVECGADCLYVVPSMSLPSTTPSFLASLKSRILLPFWYWLTQVVLEKRPRNGVTCSIPVLGPAVLSGPQVVGSEKIYGLWGTATCWTIVFTHATLCSCAVAKFSSLNAVVNLAWQGLIVETKVDASDVIIWTVVGQLSGQYLQRSAVGLSHWSSTSVHSMMPSHGFICSCCVRWCTDDRLADSVKNSPHTSTGTPRDDATPGAADMPNYSSLHYQDGINPVRCCCSVLPRLGPVGCGVHMSDQRHLTARLTIWSRHVQRALSGRRWLSRSRKILYVGSGQG